MLFQPSASAGFTKTYAAPRLKEFVNLNGVPTTTVLVSALMLTE